MRLAIIGCKRYIKYREFRMHLENYLSASNESLKCIVSGGDLGTETLAEMYAINNNITTIIYKLDWKTFNKNSHSVRNQSILNACTHCLAFMSDFSINTQIQVNMALHRNIPTTIIKID